MVVQAFTSFIYSVVQGSWIVAAIALKYVLLVQVFYALNSEGGFLESLGEEISSYSREVVSAVVLLGLLVSTAGIELSAFMTGISYFIAAVYFGYLFWEF
jgi:hypothetical protein